MLSRTGVTATSQSSGLRFSTATSVLGGSGLTGNDGTGSRWALPADPSQLGEAGDMFSRVDAMYDNIVLYGLLQVRGRRKGGRQGWLRCAATVGSSTRGETAVGMQVVQQVLLT